MKDWAGALFLRWGLRLVSDRHAWLFYKLQRLYWFSTPEGRELRRQFGDEER